MPGVRQQTSRRAWLSDTRSSGTSSVPLLSWNTGTSTLDIFSVANFRHSSEGSHGDYTGISHSTEEAQLFLFPELHRQVPCSFNFMWNKLLQVTQPLWRKRQVDLCEFRGNLIYRAKSGPARATQWDLVSIRKRKPSHSGTCLSHKERAYTEESGGLWDGRGSDWGRSTKWLRVMTRQWHPDNRRHQQTLHRIKWNDTESLIFILPSQKVTFQNNQTSKHFWNSTFEKIFWNVVCKSVLHLHAYVYMGPCVSHIHRRPEEATGSPGTRLQTLVYTTLGIDTWATILGTEPGSSAQLPVFLTAESSP